MIRLSHLLRDRSGVAMTEFALAAPFLLGFGLWGIETANLALTHLAVSQLAAHVADNGSRIGDTSTLEDRKIYESDINDLLYGASVQAGNKLELFKHGRVIISSLEVDPTSGDQYIHWQRCKGVKAHPSSYGLEGEKLPEAGMGPAGHEVIAQPDDAVIFVEIAFDYQSLVSDSFVGETEITATAAFTVRDDRDLSQIYQRDAADPDAIASCSVFDATSTRLT
jgi:hypothetical protein